MLRAQVAHAAQPILGQCAGAALALHGLDDQRGGGRPGQGFGDAGLVVERQLDVARQARAEAFEVRRIARGVDRGIGAAVERAGEADHVDPFGLAIGVVEAARRLDRAFDRLGARIAEEHHVGEGRIRQPLGEAFLSGNAEDVRHVPELARLLGQGGDQRRVRVAERVGGDPGDAIEIGAALGIIKPGALAVRNRERCAVVDRHQGTIGHKLSCQAVARVIAKMPVALPLSNDRSSAPVAGSISRVMNS